MSKSLFKEEHDIFRNSFKKFLAKEVVPYLEEWEQAGIVPRDAWKKWHERLSLPLAG